MSREIEKARKETQMGKERKAETDGLRMDGEIGQM